MIPYMLAGCSRLLLMLPCVQESILLLYVSAASGRGELGKSAPFPSTSCLTSEIAPADLESVPPDNMSDVSVPSMSALTVQVSGRRQQRLCLLAWTNQHSMLVLGLAGDWTGSHTDTSKLYLFAEVVVLNHFLDTNWFAYHLVLFACCRAVWSCCV